MLLYALKRSGVAILVAISVSIVTFSLLHVSGDPLPPWLAKARRKKTLNTSASITVSTAAPRPIR